MKILTLSNSTYGPYGYSILTKNLLKEFKKYGHEVINFGNQTLGTIIKDENGVPNLPIRFSTWYVDAFNDYLATFKPDLVISFFDVIVAEGVQIAEACQAFGVPYILHATVNYAPTSIDLIDRCKRADVVVSPSKFGINTLAQSDVQRITYIPHGIDPEKYYQDDKERAEMRKKFGVEDKFVFFMVQRNRHPQKNIPQFFGTFQNMLHHNPKMKGKCILIVLTDILEPSGGGGSPGNGLPLELLRQLLGLQNDIMFVKQEIIKEKTDYIVKATSESTPGAFYANSNLALSEHEMRKLYNMSDCLVSSSLGESFGLPIIEGQACGLPAIAPKHTTMPELIQDPEAGLLCDILEPQVSFNFSNIFQFSVISMVGCLKKMFYDEEFRKECSKNGLKNVENYYWTDIAMKDWKPLLDQFAKAVNEVDYAKGWSGL